MVDLQTTFTWIGTPLSDQLDAFIGGTFTDSMKALIVGAIPFLQDLITDGIIANITIVVVFAQLLCSFSLYLY